MGLYKKLKKIISGSVDSISMPMNYSNSLLSNIPNDLIIIIEHYRTSLGISQMILRDDVHLSAMDCKRVHVECGILNYKTCDHCHNNISIVELKDSTFCKFCLSTHFLRNNLNGSWFPSRYRDQQFNNIISGNLDNHGFRIKDNDGIYIYPTSISSDSYCNLCVGHGYKIRKDCVFCLSSKNLIKVYHWSMDNTFNFKRSNYTAGIICHNICKSCVIESKDTSSFRKELTYVCDEKFDSCLVNDKGLCYFQTNY